jgi:hypothetical protein
MIFGHSFEELCGGDLVTQYFIYRDFNIKNTLYKAHRGSSS